MSVTDLPGESSTRPGRNSQLLFPPEVVRSSFNLWVSAPDDADVVVNGNCPSPFNTALRRMFLSVTHLLEFDLPTAAEGRLAQRLDDYGWIVEVE